MLTNVLKLYGTVSGDNAANLDVPEDCVIQGVLVNASWRPTAINATLYFELSFASTNGFAANDTRAAFAGLRLAYANIAAGTGGQTAWNESVTGLLLPAAAGERIYMHILAASAGSVEITAFLYCLGSEVSRRARRRV